MESESRSREDQSTETSAIDQCSSNSDLSSSSISLISIYTTDSLFIVHCKDRVHLTNVMTSTVERPEISPIRTRSECYLISHIITTTTFALSVSFTVILYYSFPLLRLTSHFPHNS